MPMPATSARGVIAGRSALPAQLHRRRVGDRHQDEHDLEVRDRVGVAQPVVVDQRVGGDAGADAEREREGAPVAVAHAAHEQDAGRHGQHAEHLEDAERHAQRRDRHRQHDHRGRAARDRVDEREPGPRVGGGEQREVQELERGRGGDVGHARRRRRPTSAPPPARTRPPPPAAPPPCSRACPPCRRAACSTARAAPRWRAPARAPRRSTRRWRSVPPSSAPPGRSRRERGRVAELAELRGVAAEQQADGPVGDEPHPAAGAGHHATGGRCGPGTTPGSRAT